MNHSTKKGFTLIELLIVIAIIGILASIVLVSLTSARDKAKITGFKAQVHSIQAHAVLQCDSALLVVGDFAGPLPPAVNYVGAAAIAAPATVGNNCGPNGSGVFKATVQSSAAVPGACTATVQDTGVTFAGC